jgi:hypothetical protein
MHRVRDGQMETRLLASLPFPLRVGVCFTHMGAMSVADFDETRGMKGGKGFAWKEDGQERREGEEKGGGEGIHTLAFKLLTMDPA